MQKIKEATVKIPKPIETKVHIIISNAVHRFCKGNAGMGIPSAC